MRIGIDARTTQGRFTGDATYWRGLIEGLSRLDMDDEIVLYLDANSPAPQLSLARPLETRMISAMNWRTWSLLAFPRALRKDLIDVAHVQYTIPPYMPCPVVTTVHDISFKRHPGFFAWKDRTLLDIGVKRAGTQAAQILAVSEYTKKEIIDLYHISPEKITVIYEGADDQFKPLDRGAARKEVEARYKTGYSFILTVGVIQPRKNLPRLIEGFAKLDKAFRSAHKLVIVGKYGWKESSLLQQIDNLGIASDIVLTGYVPYEELPLFYNAAEVFVYPSVYEGFGLPPLESMACGTPVITGNQSSLPEVLGDAGLMVDPYDPDAFTQAITNIMSSESLRADMSMRGLEQAKKFSWVEMARRVMDLYRTL